MPIPVVCPSCATKLRAPEKMAGRKTKCPKCGTVVVVPNSAPEAPAPVRAESLPQPVKRVEPPATQRALPTTPDAYSDGLPGVALPPQPVAKTTECPFCGETILATAKKCKHCGELLDTALRLRAESRQAPAQPAINVQVSQIVTVGVNPLTKSSNPFLSALGNVLWIVFGGGLVLFIQYLLAGVFLCLTVVGIPFGLQCIKLANLALLPFGKQIVFKESAAGCLATVLNLLWIVVGGVWIALTHVLFACLCAITVILLPFAKQHMKLAALGLQPFGKEVR